jgi:hypothetical protein
MPLLPEKIGAAILGFEPYCDFTLTTYYRYYYFHFHHSPMRSIFQSCRLTMAGAKPNTPKRNKQ